MHKNWMFAVLPALACLLFSQDGVAQAVNPTGSVVSGTVADEASVRFLQNNFDVWLARSQPDGTGTVDIWRVTKNSAQLWRKFPRALCREPPPSLASPATARWKKPIRRWNNWRNATLRWRTLRTLAIAI